MIPAWEREIAACRDALASTQLTIHLIRIRLGKACTLTRAESLTSHEEISLSLQQLRRSHSILNDYSGLALSGMIDTPETEPGHPDSLNVDGFANLIMDSHRLCTALRTAVVTLLDFRRVLRLYAPNSEQKGDILNI